MNESAARNCAGSFGGLSCANRHFAGRGIAAAYGASTPSTAVPRFRFID
jgi:hypothetical protein